MAPSYQDHLMLVEAAHRNGTDYWAEMARRMGVDRAYLLERFVAPEAAKRGLSLQEYVEQHTPR